MSESILTSTKKLLNIEADYTEFDVDIMMHINTALSNLNQLGVGPLNGFMITSTSETWTDFLGVDPRLFSAKTYVYCSVRLDFDPPATSFHIQALEKRRDELAWRLEVARAAPVETLPVIDGGLAYDIEPL